MSDRYRKTRKLLLAGGHLLRAFLLIVSAVAVACFLIWTGNRGLVDRVDEAIVARYEGRHNDKLISAMSLLEQGRHAEAAGALDALISGMGQVRKQDRLSPVYISAIDALLTASIQIGDEKRALEAARAQVEFDPNNYRFWLNLAYILNVSGSRKEAIDALYKAYAIAPHFVTTTEPLATLLYEDSRKSEAKKVIEGFKNANRGGYIVLSYYFAGENSNRNSIRFDSIAFNGKRQTFAFPIMKGGIERIRIDFPWLPDLRLSIKSITVFGPDGHIKLDTAEFPIRWNDMARQPGGSLTISGTDPSMEFPLPAELGGRVDAVEMEAEFFHELPPKLYSLLRDA